MLRLLAIFPIFAAILSACTANYCASWFVNGLTLNGEPVGPVTIVVNSTSPSEQLYACYRVSYGDYCKLTSKATDFPVVLTLVNSSSGNPITIQSIEQSLCGLGYSATVLVAVELPDGSLYIYWIGVKELTTNLASSNFSVATIVNMAQDLYVSRLLDINTEGDERLWDKNLYYGDAVPETEVPASSAQYSFHALEFMQPPQPPYVVAYPLGTFSFKGGARYVGVIIGSTSLAPDNGPRLVFVPVNEPSENRTKIIIIAVITSVGGVLLIAGLVLIGHRMMTRRRYD